MTMPIDLVLVRHGESEGNAAVERSKRGDHSAYTPEFIGRHSARWRLTDRGREQAQAAGTWLKCEVLELPDFRGFERCYTSEYIRAMETAAHLGLEDTVWFRDFNLRERDRGELDVVSSDESRRHLQIFARQQRAEPFFTKPPNGESLADVCLRLRPFLETLHRECSNKCVLVVCHGEVMWCFRILLERMSQERFQTLCLSGDPRDRIFNGHVIHYTRRMVNVRELALAPYLTYMRSVCPTHPASFLNSWEEIVRPRFTNHDIRAIVERIPQLVNNS